MKRQALFLLLWVAMAATAQKAQAQTEYEMDMENNDLQQDMITVQGLISKRDDSYSTAAKVLKKVNSTGNSIINSIGN